MYFPTAEITCNPLIPFTVALCVSFCTSMGGVSGAFILLPFQMSVLGYTNPSVSATNQFFNIIACPSGIIRYAREGRLLWPIATTIALGTVPGVFIGALIRIELLPDPKNFTVFAGCVLLYIGLRMLHTLYTGKKKEQALAASAQDTRITECTYSRSQIAFSFGGTRYTVATKGLFLLSAVVGLIGGIYGIGGGAIMAPFLISFFGIPVYVLAGATLMATTITSVAGVIFYWLLSFVYTQIHTAPDIALGLCIGLGGMVGMYFGAKCQKYVRASYIKAMLVLILLGLGLRYILQGL